MEIIENKFMRELYIYKPFLNFEMTNSYELELVTLVKARVAPGMLRRGDDSSDKGVKIQFLGYHKSQASPKKLFLTFRRGASML